MADGSEKPRYESMKTRRVRIESKTYRRAYGEKGQLKTWFWKVSCLFTMNRGKSSQNRYCCVPLCDQKGSTGPNGERVGFFSIPTEKHLREQWLHAIRREPGKHFSVTDSTKVCSLHFKDEHLKKSFGLGRLTYIEGAVPSVFAWKRSFLIAMIALAFKVEIVFIVIRFNVL